MLGLADVEADPHGGFVGRTHCDSFRGFPLIAQEGRRRARRHPPYKSAIGSHVPIRGSRAEQCRWQPPLEPSVAAGPVEPCRHCWASWAQRLLSPWEQRKGVRPSPTPASPLRLSTASRSAPTSSRPAASLTACRSPPPRWEVPRRADHDQGGWGQTDHHGGANGVVIPTTRRGPSAAPPTTTRFNPRPARRPGATRHVGWLARHARRVSILAPARRPGATRRDRHVVRHRVRVSIVARPEGRGATFGCTWAMVWLHSFQSSPGPKAGRYVARDVDRAVRLGVSILARPEGRALPSTRRARPSARTRFNPRPARRPGATRGRSAVRGDREAVSILARAEGRALRVPICSITCGLYMFQSSPGPKAGRYLSSIRPGSFSGACFNPRPARRPGATSSEKFRTRNTRSLFQSSPGPKAGRYSASSRYSVRRSAGFQSSPGPKAGRYSEVDRRIRQAHNRVSILARPEGRALPPRLLRPQHAAQPVSILARPEGRALLGGSMDFARESQDVSILARPEGRALPPRLLRPQTRRSARFNPRPARRPGATSRPTAPSCAMFQSSPGPKAGRYHSV